MPFFSESFNTRLESKGSGSSTYLSPSQLADGGTMRFLVLSEEPITGFELWLDTPDGKSVGRRTQDEPTPEVIAAMEKEVGGKLRTNDNGKPSIKDYAAFFVYDYDSSSVKVFNATQTTILKELERQLSDPDFSDLTAWDVEIGRKGLKLATEYTVTLKPTRAKGPIATAAQDAYAAALAAGASLEALFTPGGNPLGGGGGAK